jgi:hypothetical protein
MITVIWTKSRIATENNHRADDHAYLLAYDAVGYDVEHQAKHLKLGRNPSQIRGDDTERTKHLNTPIVP